MRLLNTKVIFFGRLIHLKKIMKKVLIMFIILCFTLLLKAQKNEIKKNFRRKVIFAPVPTMTRVAASHLKLF